MAEEGAGKEKATTFRMSAADYAALRREVETAGYSSLQALLEVRVFGAVRADARRGPKPKDRQTERLDISA